MIIFLSVCTERALFTLSSVRCLRLDQDSDLTLWHDSLGRTTAMNLTVGAILDIKRKQRN